MQQLHLQTAIFSFCCEMPASVSHAASHSNELCLLLNPLHITFEYLSMLVPNNCKHYSSYCRLCPEHLDKWCGMFPFHFAHWLKVVDQWFVPSSDVFKESLTLLTTVSPRNWQDFHITLHMFLCQLFWNMCTDCTKVKVVMNDWFHGQNHDRYAGGLLPHQWSCT